MNAGLSEHLNKREYLVNKQQDGQVFLYFENSEINIFLGLNTQLSAFQRILW